ncbi:L-glyceraldehyde 3-phosphate reductase [Polystyrenella longa]|uniref:L-glyceraldehyde 3-phosphate reductase n=1 Tax=Polystyrenella longa TaxID=2528007 RepID=A0A518CLV0_9PLAN|nr:aldo/keto reductase [Polystyrenella longa]QDU80205.1 L-glyceraldehyde 3-phosphate reductase [Polystyrenella longa]
MIESYRQLGQTGLKVSPLCLGTMMFGGPTNETDSISMIHESIDLGINFIDTANIYNAGESEVVVGKALTEKRDNVVLATKAGQKMGEGVLDQGSSRKHLTKALDDSLRRLQTDYIDLYYIHVPDYDTPLEETLRTLDDMIRSGKVRYIACSNFRTWKLAEATLISNLYNLNLFCCAQPLYNIVNRDVEVDLLPYCDANGMGVVTYSPLARGILTGKYQPGAEVPAGSRASRKDARMQQAEWREESLVVASELKNYCDKKQISCSQFALAWVMANPVISSVIIGPRTREQFADNLEILKIDISAEDEAFVDSLVPTGEHSGKGFQDSAYPITGRPV